MSRTTAAATVGVIALTWGALQFSSVFRDNSQASGRGHQPPTPTEVKPDRLNNVRIGLELIDKDCQGEQVSLIQHLLNQHGANPPLAITGNFDAATLRATKQFQRTHNGTDGRPLAVDGVIGPLTLAALELHPFAPPPHAEHQSSSATSANLDPLHEVLNQIRLLKEGDQDPAVGAAKKLLNAAGANPSLKEDELFTPAMTRAVRSFQAQWNGERSALPELHLPVDGLIRSRTAKALKEKADISTLESAAKVIGDFMDNKIDGGTALANDATFREALKLVLKFEGGVSSDPRDNGNSGGNATNQGITQATYNRYRDLHKAPQRSVLKMTEGERDQIYYQFYWKEARCDELPHNLAVLCFNSAVNMGVAANARMLCDSMGLPRSSRVSDAIIHSVRQYESVSLAEHYTSLVEQRYKLIAERGQNHRYLNGWLRRLEHTRLAAGIRGTGRPLMALTGQPSEDFGPSIRQGIIELQIVLNLPQTGELDSRTEKAL